MRRPPRRALFALGGAALFLCAAGAFVWFYVLRPRRLLFDEAWITRHTASEIARVAEKAIRRTGWFHDDGGLVDGYEWVAWIMDHMKPGDEIGACWGGHLDQALFGMTNQKAGTTAEAWLEWWERNKHKTQVEWYREGFAEEGLVPETPLTKGNVIALLRMVGRGPRSRQAFRWLRDSDFSPSSFSVADLPEEAGDEVLTGLVRFAGLRERVPKREDAYILPIGEPVRDHGSRGAPISSPWCDVAVLAVLVIFLGAGAACLWSGAKNRPPVPPPEHGA